MVERGHFAELVHILDMVEREANVARLSLLRSAQSTPQAHTLPLEPAQCLMSKGCVFPQAKKNGDAAPSLRQTFVFSATLTGAV